MLKIWLLRGGIVKRETFLKELFGRESLGEELSVNQERQGEQGHYPFKIRISGSAFNLKYIIGH